MDFKEQLRLPWVEAGERESSKAEVTERQGTGKQGPVLGLLPYWVCFLRNGLKSFGIILEQALNTTGQKRGYLIGSREPLGGLKLGKSMNRAVLQEERADTEIWAGFEWEQWQEQRQKGHLEVLCYG